MLPMCRVGLPSVCSPTRQSFLETPSPTHQEASQPQASLHPIKWTSEINPHGPPVPTAPQSPFWPHISVLKNSFCSNEKPASLTLIRHLSMHSIHRFAQYQLPSMLAVPYTRATTMPPPPLNTVLSFRPPVYPPPQPRLLHGSPNPPYCQFLQPYFLFQGEGNEKEEGVAILPSTHRVDSHSRAGGSSQSLLLLKTIHDFTFHSE